MSKKFISRPGILLFSLSIILFSEIFRFKGILSVPLLRDTEKKRMGGYAFFVLGVFGGARMSVPAPWNACPVGAQAGHISLGRGLFRPGGSVVSLFQLLMDKLFVVRYLG